MSSEEPSEILNTAFETTIRKVRAAERIAQAAKYAGLAADALEEAVGFAPEIGTRAIYQMEALSGHVSQLTEMLKEITFLPEGWG